MDDRTGPLRPEDYVEPRCVLCGEPYGTQHVERVPQQRIIEKMDEYMARRDYAGAERHLLYWLEEAKAGGDKRASLMLCGELVGHYRKTGEEEKCFARADEALTLIQALDFKETISAGTAWVNIATAYSAFGQPERALTYFEKARAVYEANETTAPQLLGGLYNNMALACAAIGRFGEAHALYDRAMACMERVPGGALEQAVTCLNRADAVFAEKGSEDGEAEIAALLEQAWALLHAPGLRRDGYCAFVYEKCAPSFAYYGRFLDAEELKKEAETIYEGT